MNEQTILFQNEFNHISPKDLEDMMEWLNDNECLSNKGKNFRHNFWELFIKSNN